MIREVRLNEDVVLYHANSNDVIPTLPLDEDGVAVVSDPPYGMAYNPRRGAKSSKPKWESDDMVIGDKEPFDPRPLLRAKSVILWGANNFAARLPDGNGWLVWDKAPRGAVEGFYYSHCELAWTNVMGRVQKFAKEWTGKRGTEGFVHPTQKPVELMKWCIELIKPKLARTVVDPYMGSGTTGVAAVKLGRKFIGIELDAKHFESALKRIQEAISQPDLLAAPVVKPKQELLL